MRAILRPVERSPPPPTVWRRAQWRVLLATSFCYLFYYTGRQNFGWAIPGLRQDLGLTNTQLGWISGAGLVTYGLGQMVSGHLGNRFGNRRLVVAGALLSCALNWLTGFARGVWSLGTPWAANGLAQALGFAPGSHLIAHWWGPRERGVAFGVFSFAAGFSSVLTFLGAMLVLGRLDWRWVFRLPVLLMVAGALVFHALVRDRPEHVGFPPPDGVPADRGPGQAPSLRADYREVLGNRRFLIASLGFGFNNWARLGLLGWVPVHFLGSAWREDPGAAWITLALPAGMALGALASGYGADRYLRADHARLIAPCLALATLTILGMYGAPRDASGLGVVLLFVGGFLVFGPLTSFNALGAELVGGHAMGTAIGFMNAVGYGTAALGDVVIGVALDATGRTESMFLVTSAACLLGAACGAAIRRMPSG
ncbi:MAG TPA: MFS transporter [Methylomirabilota bacterium]|nr:MFS transporter [Methylomirabilota bacterium]